MWKAGGRDYEWKPRRGNGKNFMKSQIKSVDCKVLELIFYYKTQIASKIQTFCPIDFCGNLVLTQINGFPGLFVMILCMVLRVWAKA